jgi:hypothetical protein
MQTTHSLDAFGTRHPAVNAFSPSPGGGVALDGFSQSKQFNDVPVLVLHVMLLQPYKPQSIRPSYFEKMAQLPLDVFETMIDIICELPLQQRRICLRALTTTNRATGAIAEQKLWSILDSVHVLLLLIPGFVLRNGVWVCCTFFVHHRSLM